MSAAALKELDMAARKYNCPRCHLSFVSAKNPSRINCPACGARLPPPANSESQKVERGTLTSGVFKLATASMLVVSSPVILISSILGGGESSATPQARRRGFGMGVGVILFLAAAGSIIYFMIRAVTEAPDPTKIKDAAAKKAKDLNPDKIAQETQPVSQTQGVPILNQMYSEKSPDLSLLMDKIQDQYHTGTVRDISLPPLDTLKIWTLTPDKERVTPEKMAEYNQIVDRFIQYHAGKLTGADGQKAVNDFQKLTIDAIPALVRGVNDTALLGDSPIFLVARKVQTLLEKSDDLEMLSYCVANVGKGLLNAPHQDAVNALKAFCEKQMEIKKKELGKNLPRMLAALKNPDAQVRVNAANALGVMGQDAKPAIPDLIKTLKDQNKDVRERAAQALVQMGPEAVPPLKEALKEKGTSNLAALALAEQKPVTQDTVKSLIENLKEPDPNDRQGAEAALVKVGPPAVNSLMKALDEKDKRSPTAKVLGNIGEPAKPALPLLVQGLKDPDPEFRMTTHNALVKMGKPAVADLALAIKDPDDKVWYSAFVALGKIGPDAKEAIPALTSALEDKNRSVRMMAVHALVRIDPNNKALSEHAAEVVPVLTDVLKHEDKNMRSWAAVSLGRFGRNARDAVPLLVDALKDKEAGVRSSVAEALGKIQTDEKDAVKALILAQADADAEVAVAVRAALVKIGAPAVPGLIGALNDGQESLRLAAAEVLAKIGRPALPELISAMQDPKTGERSSDGAVRRAVAGIFEKIGPAAAPAAPALLAALSDSNRYVRLQVLDALKSIKPATPEALQTLLTVMQDTNVAVSDSARETLLSLRMNPEAIPLLTATLKDKDPARRILAAAMLQKIGASARESVPALIETLKDNEAKARGNAAAALGIIQPRTTGVIAALIAALHDGDAEVRAEAQRSLVRGGRLAVALLEQALADASATVRFLAVEALQKIGSDAKSACPALVNELKDVDRLVRLQTVLALREIDPTAEKVLQGFISALTDPDPEVRRAAHLALVHQARECVPHLVKALSASEVETRRGVVETLKKIGMEQQADAELKAAIADLVLAMKDADKDVRMGAGWALEEIDPELQPAVPALRRALTEPRPSEKPALAKKIKDVRYFPEDALVELAAFEKGAELEAIVREYARRRSERILAALALATIHNEGPIRDLARKLLGDYLNAKPKEKDNEQARARLHIAKLLIKSGNKTAADDRLKVLIREMPNTPAAEEARRILAGEKPQL